MTFPALPGFSFKVFDRPVLDDGQAGRFRSDPKIAPAVLEQKNNPVAVQSRRVHLVENGETTPVKPHQAVQRAEPEITVVRLGDGDDFAVGQAFLGVPGIHDERRVGPGRPARPAPKWRGQRRQARARRIGAPIVSSA